MVHALAKEDVNTVMLWLSKESPHGQVLRKAISWGFLNKLGHSGSVSLVMREFGGDKVETQEIQVLKTKIGPTFINANDMT